MSLLARVIRKRSIDPWPSLTLNDYIQMLNYGGLQYAPQPQFTLGQKTEEIVPNFTGIVQGALKTNGIVFACMVARAQLFSEAVFKFQRLAGGRPGDLFGTKALVPLEKPWSKATTGDLIARMSMDADLSGNAYLALGDTSPLDPGGARTIRRLRPDWVTVIGGSRKGLDTESPLWQWDVEPIGYIYHPGGRGHGKPQMLLATEVAHFTPWGLDPEAALIGMSPLGPIVEEIMADKAMTVHKRMYLENGATPNLVVTLPEAVTPSQFDEWVAAFDAEHEGVMNAYRTIYLGGGADTKIVGSDLRNLSFAEVQTHGEARIAAALRVEAIIAGIQAGLDTATYSNYAQALRAFGDLTARPWWRNAAGSLAPLINVPPGSRLWYDERDIAFLRDDAKNIAEIQVRQATAGELWVRAGYEPDSVISCLAANDITLLKHSGLVSVQLLPPGTVQSPKSDGPTPIGESTPKPVAKPAPKPKPTPKRAALPVLVRHRDQTDPLRELDWTSMRMAPTPSVTCMECARHAELVNLVTARCECGAYWHIHEHDYERGSALIERYVPQGEQYVYERVELISSTEVLYRANGHSVPTLSDTPRPWGLVTPGDDGPAALPPGPPPR